MSYRLISFDGVDLPQYNPEAGPQTLPSRVAYVGTIDGWHFDGYIGTVARNAPRTYTHTATISEGSLDATNAAYDALLGKKGRIGTLVARIYGGGVGDANSTRSTSARLIDVSEPAYTGVCNITITLTFAAGLPHWNGDYHEITETITPSEITYVDELPLQLIENTETINGELVTITNHGNAYQTHVIATLTIGGVVPLPVVGIRNYTTGHWWPVIDTGNPMLPGQKVRFDSGALQVQLLDSGGNFIRNLWNRSYNYGSFTEWFALAPGDNEIEFGFGDATGTGYEAKITYSDAWH